MSGPEFGAPGTSRHDPCALLSGWPPPTRAAAGGPALRIGVVADTHGLLRPELLAALRGADHILHAGDIGRAGVVEALAELAPVTAIRGNVDHGLWATAYPLRTTVRLGGIAFYLLHDIAELEHGTAQDVDMIVAGHSHRPCLGMRGQALFLNPGSAGPRRFRLPVTCAHVLVAQGTVRAHITDLLP